MISQTIQKLMEMTSHNENYEHTLKLEREIEQDLKILHDKYAISISDDVRLITARNVDTIVKPLIQFYTENKMVNFMITIALVKFNHIDDMVLFLKRLHFAEKNNYSCSYLPTLQEVVYSSFALNLIFLKSILIARDLVYAFRPSEPLSVDISKYLFKEIKNIFKILNKSEVLQEDVQFDFIEFLLCNSHDKSILSSIDIYHKKLFLELLMNSFNDIGKVKPHIMFNPDNLSDLLHSLSQTLNQFSDEEKLQYRVEICDLVKTIKATVPKLHRKYGFADVYHKHVQDELQLLTTISNKNFAKNF